MSVLFIPAHSDNEVSGCGGTIASFADSVDQVEVLTLAEGSTSRQRKRDRVQVRDELSAPAQAAHTAGSIHAAAGVKLLGPPDNRLDSFDRLDLINSFEESVSIEECVDCHQSEGVYVHHVGDAKVDHRRLREAGVTACMPMPGLVVKRLLSVEVVISTELQPSGSVPVFESNWFDISDQWERKREALVAYSSEMRDWPHARSLKAVEHLARWRGAQVGVEAAEAFCLLRQLV